MIYSLLDVTGKLLICAHFYYCRFYNRDAFPCKHFVSPIYESSLYHRAVMQPSSFRIRISCTSATTALKRKNLHFDEMFIIGCIGSCQNDNFQCNQWWKFRQNDDIFVSVGLSSVSVILPVHARLTHRIMRKWLLLQKYDFQTQLIKASLHVLTEIA